MNSGQDIRHSLLTARLPAMPHTLARLIDLSQDEGAGLEDFADLIIKDPAVTMHVLEAASNPACSNFSRDLCMRQALLALGMDTVKSLLINESVSQVFNGFTQSDHHDLRGFWRHSYATALAAREIAVTTSYPHPEEAYFAGLLHDIGRLALLSAAPAEYSVLLSHIDDAGLCVAEKQTFGMTHAEAGALLIERFRLDSFIADSVLYHHEPTKQVVAAHPLIRIVVLADLIAGQGMDDAVIDASKTIFNLDAASLKNIHTNTEQRVQETAKFLKIDLSGTEHAMAVPYPSKRANNDGSARDRLTDAVQGVTLAAEVRRSFFRAGSEAELMPVIVKSAALQFGLQDVLLLMQDDDGRYLRGVPLESSRQGFAEFSVPLESGGAVAAALVQQQVVFLDAGTDLHSLAEKQLFRLLHAQHLVCLPLSAGQYNLGVIIGATAADRLAELRSRTNFLKTFAGQAAAAINAVRAKVAETGRIAESYRQASRRVVHEASNPLSIIRNYLAVLDAKVKRKEPVQTEVSILSQEIDHVVEILREHSEMKNEVPKEMLGINQVVSNVVKFLQVTGFVPPSIGIEVQLHDEVAGVKVDSKVLKQVLTNLIKNAVEALQEGGEIVVSTPSFINRDGRLYGLLTVSDNGPGIPAPVLAKLFSPVRSVKSGNHAGLGLSIVRSLVQDIDGIVICRSSNSGTIFEVLLPVGDAIGDSTEGNPLDMKSTGGIYGRD